VPGAVVVAHTAELEPQLFTQKAATPKLPTAQRFPPETANVTELRVIVVATWLMGNLVHDGEESRDNP